MKIPGTLPPVHACPIGDSGFTPCCHRTPFELPSTDRMTLDDSLVTCGRKIVVAIDVVPVEPVPAPRLERLAWVEIEPFVWQAVSRPYEIRYDGRGRRKFNLWARNVERGAPLVFLGHAWMDTHQEAMELAERIEAVLSPPVGPT